MGAQIPVIAEKPLTTCGYRKFQLDPLGDHLNITPFLAELTCTEWVSVEATNTPCLNELGRKGRTINTKGVDGVIPKHWSTFRVRCPTGPFPVSPVPVLAGYVVHGYRLSPVEWFTG